MLEGVDGCLKALAQVIAEKRRKCLDALMKVAMAYQADVQQLSPVDTGQYRASIRTEPGDQMGEPVVVRIGTDKPQACRLEFGFYGPDSLGRVYHQAPRPHFRPPIDQNGSKYRDIIMEALSE